MLPNHPAGSDDGDERAGTDAPPPSAPPVRTRRLSRRAAILTIRIGCLEVGRTVSGGVSEPQAGSAS